MHLHATQHILRFFLTLVKVSIMTKCCLVEDGRIYLVLLEGYKLTGLHAILHGTNFPLGEILLGSVSALFPSGHTVIRDVH